MSTDSKRVALDVIDWMWGTVKGSFNDKMDISQIVVDAVIGMIPLVGDVTAARDLIAISLGLAGDPKKREDKMQWILLVIFVFALIPVAGGVIKGVARLALEITEDIAKNAKILEEVIAFLNRVGHGNAVKWLKELDVLKYQSQIIERLHALLDTMVTTLERVKTRLSSVLPDAMIATMNAWSAGLKAVRQVCDKMIPEALKELNAKLQRLQQLVYKGEWHAVVPGARNTTREAEARLVEENQVAARAGTHVGWKQNRASTTAADEIAKVYKWEPGYADLMKRIGPTATEKEAYQQIAAFSGKITASEVHGGEYMLRIHEPGGAVSSWWVRLPHGVTDANWREFMKNGKEWREVLAVLEEFSKNGAFSICRVKPGKAIKAWEGRASEQFGMKNPGQHLPGGAEQLFVEAWAEWFDKSVDWVVREGKTGWTDLEHVGFASVNVETGAARTEELGANELQSKRSGSGGRH